MISLKDFLLIQTLLKLYAKLFESDTSLFSVIHDSQTSANILNKDLETIYNWIFEWKMNFNTDFAKQAQEVILTRKTKNYLILP